jgi:hypothetical protein
MRKDQLVYGLKLLLAEFIESEEYAKDAGNDNFVSGLQYARVNLEVVLEKNGISSTSTFTPVDEIDIKSLR